MTMVDVVYVDGDRAVQVDEYEGLYKLCAMEMYKDDMKLKWLCFPNRNGGEPRYTTSAVPLGDLETAINVLSDCLSVLQSVREDTAEGPKLQGQEDLWDETGKEDKGKSDRIPF